ncbi:MAG: hypothetical protein WCO44_05090 [Bacteroidota bacterium]
MTPAWTGSQKPANKNIFLLFTGSALLLLLVLVLVGRLSHPLFWADEGMTVVGAERVLQYGYPKVHDGQNVLYDLDHPDKTLGTDPRTDAYIGGANWGMYYFAAIPVKLAEGVGDLYDKTFLIRLAFLAAGLAGLLLLAWSITMVFPGTVIKFRIFAVLLLLMLLSVPFLLHIREARYYSPALLLEGCLTVLYIRCRILDRMRYGVYLLALPVILTALFLFFSPAFFICLVTCFIFDIFLLTREFATNPGWKGNTVITVVRVLKPLIPLILALACVIPLLKFFDSFRIAGQIALYNQYDTGVYLNNLAVVWRDLSARDMLWAALVMKVIHLCLAWMHTGKLNRRQVINLDLSLFTGTFVVVYMLMIAAIPNYVFTRYLFPLMPLISLMFLADATSVCIFLKEEVDALRKQVRRLIQVMIIYCCMIPLYNNRHDIIAYYGSLFSVYQGPLDVMIPRIRQLYKDPSKLVIATNYEETSFMYYLKAKVIVGFVGNNLASDTLLTPDIISIRRGWKANREILGNFRNRARYLPVFFPVKDNLFNNIPELNYEDKNRHHFRTLMTSDPAEQTVMFLIVKP